MKRANWYYMRIIYYANKIDLARNSTINRFSEIDINANKPNAVLKISFR
jgi:hypothetical protein